MVKKWNNQVFTFDFADFRSTTITKDLAHRDFTINTLCVDVKDCFDEVSLFKKLLHPEKALKDLKAKTIRMISVKSFKEDPLRLLRGFSLQATLDFKIEAKTLSQIKKDKSLLHDVSVERIRDEFFKVLMSDTCAKNLRHMDKIGFLEEVIPQITVMFGVTQGGYHHLDVWPHSLEVVAQLENVLKEFKDDTDIQEYLNVSFAGTRNRLGLLKLGCLLHDIGKPQTKKIEAGKTSFHAHERVGKGITRSIAKMLKFSKDERYALEDMVLWHLRPGYLADFKAPSARAVFRYFRDAKEEALSILLLSLADQRSTRGPLTTEHDQKHHEEILKKLIAQYLEQKKQKPLVKLISGHDLIRNLKLKPGPIFAKILREVEEKQATGQITEKVQALELARDIAQKS